MPWTAYLQRTLYAGLLTDDRAQFVGACTRIRAPAPAVRRRQNLARALVDGMSRQLAEAERLSPVEI